MTFRLVVRRSNDNRKKQEHHHQKTQAIYIMYQVHKSSVHLTFKGKTCKNIVVLSVQQQNSRVAKEVVSQKEKKEMYNKIQCIVYLYILHGYCVAMLECVFCIACHYREIFIFRKHRIFFVSFYIKKLDDFFAWATWEKRWERLDDFLSRLYLKKIR